MDKRQDLTSKKIGITDKIAVLGCLALMLLILSWLFVDAYRTIRDTKNYMDYLLQLDFWAFFSAILLITAIVVVVQERIMVRKSQDVISKRKELAEGLAFKNWQIWIFLIIGVVLFWASIRFENDRSNYFKILIISVIGIWLIIISNKLRARKLDKYLSGFQKFSNDTAEGLKGEFGSTYTEIRKVIDRYFQEDKDLAPYFSSNIVMVDMILFSLKHNNSRSRLNSTMDTFKEIIAKHYPSDFKIDLDQLETEIWNIWISDKSKQT